MNHYLRLFLAIVLTLGTASVGHAKELKGPKKRIAISVFKDKSNHHDRHWKNVGQGMAEMLTTALQKTGDFIVVERNQLGSAIEEQQMAKDGAVQEATAAKSGQLIGAGFMVTGAVTEFGIRDAKYGVGKLDRILPIGGDASLKTQTARVALDLRFFDTTTGQVIATEQAVGTKTSRKVATDIDNLPSAEFGKEGFDSTVIGQATREAIENAVALVKKHMEKSPWVGRVVKVDGENIFINTGIEDERKVGDSFEVVRAGETMIDPDTGEALGAERKKIGQILITEVIAKRLSKASSLRPGEYKAGDIIE